MNWQRLDRKTTQQVIESVKSSSDPGLLSASTSEAKCARLPFYKTYLLYSITNYASLPSFTFEYLGDGTFFQYLDGTADPIHTVNDKGALSLNEQSVLGYLDFYFGHVTADDGDIFIVQDPYNMPFVESLDEASHDAIIKNHKVAEVTLDADSGSFGVNASLFYDGVLNWAQIEVSRKGRVKILAQTMMVSAVGGGAITSYYS